MPDTWLVDGGARVGRIVVGVDGSADARNALAWAAAEARLRRAALEVVHAYHFRELAAPSFVSSEHALPGTVVGLAGEPSRQDVAAALQDEVTYDEAFRTRAEQILDHVLGDLSETLSGVDVHRTVVKDRHPADALREVSGGADLLVVGSRGRGGFSELLLGSVSHAVVMHAVCPVVVVPLERAGRSD